MERRFKYLWDNQVVYRRDPITDIPDEETREYVYNLICNACILKYNSKELGIDDVETTDTVVDDI